MTKRERVLKHLKSGKTLTKAQAWAWWRIINTGDIIHVLRNLGYDIKTKMQSSKGSRYAIYSL
jgi:hypothetical protein